jgi:hypothetical protein
VYDSGPRYGPVPSRYNRSAEGETLDSRKFDELVQRLSESLSRRNIVGGTVGASLLAAAGLGAGEAGEDALAKGHGKGRGKDHRGRAHEHDADAGHKKHHHRKKKKKKKCKKVGQSCASKKCCKNLLCSGGICVSLS